MENDWIEDAEDGGVDGAEEDCSAPVVVFTGQLVLAPEEEAAACLLFKRGFHLLLTLDEEAAAG